MTLGLIDRHTYELTGKGIKELERLDELGPLLHNFSSKWWFVEELFNIRHNSALTKWFFKNDFLTNERHEGLGIQELGTAGETWCREHLFDILYKKMKDMRPDSEMMMAGSGTTRCFERAFVYLEAKYLPEFLSSENRHIREACEKAVETNRLRIENEN